MVRDIIIPRFFLKHIEASYHGVSYTAFVRLSLCNNNNSHCPTIQDSICLVFFCIHDISNNLKLICGQKSANKGQTSI